MKRLTGRSLTLLDLPSLLHSTEIDIDGGYTIEEDMNILATALTDPLCTLERLQLHYFSLKAGSDFIEAIKSEGCTLKTLHLYENRLGEEEAQQLASALKVNTSIETVILNECQMDCAAATALAAGLEENDTLKTVNVWDNEIGDEGAIALAEALKKNTALCTLNLWGNKIGNGGAKAFADSLRENDTLRDLIFVYNQIGDEGGDELVSALEVNEGIRNLDLFGNPLDPAIITDVYCRISNPERRRYEGELNRDDAFEGLRIDKSCFQGGDTESTDSPTGVEEVSGCCWTGVVIS